MATEKFKALTHYIIHRCSDHPNQLGSIRLYKTLWFSDVIAYQLRGESITGESYVKRQRGPVPKHILATLEEFEHEGKIVVVRPRFLYDTTKYIALLPPDVRPLSEDDKVIASDVLDALLQRTANAVSEMTHDLIWHAAHEGEEIPLYATLAAVPGDVTPDVVDWGMRAAEQRSSA